MKKKYTFTIWLFSILLAVNIVNNIDKIEYLNNIFNDKEPSIQPGDSKPILANSLSIELKEVFVFQDGYKTAFLSYNDTQNENFNINNLAIYFQNGIFIDPRITNKDVTFKNFTEDYNGGVKNVFIYKNVPFAYLSMLEGKCYYAGIVNTQNNKIIFRTSCLPNKNLDLNGLGSASIHLEKSILLSIGAPEMNKTEIADLAQMPDSYFGKIIEIDKNELDKVLSNEIEIINPKIYSLGHRNPQGLISLNNKIFSTEHGPQGGDELNEILLGKNYGWPISSYGIKYPSDKSETKFLKSHEQNNFEEPLFALIPSIGLSSLNVCPKKISNFYNKPCLMATSLWGNDLRQGKSILFYLLNDKMNRVISVEKIFLGDEYRLRHFVTLDNNQLYEDNSENIYLSIDGKGIYSLNFTIID